MALLTLPRPAAAGALPEPRSARLLLACLLAALAGLATAGAQVDAPPDEYAVKAAFLYNFARFVDWPPEALGSPGEPLTLCVFGEDPFEGVLDRTIAGKSVHDRRIVVSRPLDEVGLASCRILFVSSSERERFRSVLEAVPRQGVLTVGEEAEFTHAGGMISLLRREDRIRFRINYQAAEEAGLKISSRLLDLAEKNGAGARAGGH